MTIFEWKRLIDIDLKKTRKMRHVTKSKIVQDAIANLRTDEGREMAKCLIDLRPNQCRWPVGNGFCDCDKTETMYCRKHYQKSKVRSPNAQEEIIIKEDDDYDQYSYAREIQAIVDHEQSLR